VSVRSKLCETFSLVTCARYRWTSQTFIKIPALWRQDLSLVFSQNNLFYILHRCGEFCAQMKVKIPALWSGVPQDLSLVFSLSREQEWFILWITPLRWILCADESPTVRRGFYLLIRHRIGEKSFDFAMKKLTGWASVFTSIMFDIFCFVTSQHLKTRLSVIFMIKRCGFTVSVSQTVSHHWMTCSLVGRNCRFYCLGFSN